MPITTDYNKANLLWSRLMPTKVLFMSLIWQKKGDSTWSKQPSQTANMLKFIAKEEKKVTKAIFKITCASNDTSNDTSGCDIYNNDNNRW